MKAVLVLFALFAFCACLIEAANPCDRFHRGGVYASQGNALCNASCQSQRKTGGACWRKKSRRYTCQCGRIIGE